MTTRTSDPGPVRGRENEVFFGHFCTGRERRCACLVAVVFVVVVAVFVVVPPRTSSSRYQCRRCLFILVRAMRTSA